MGTAQKPTFARLYTCFVRVLLEAYYEKTIRYCTLENCFQISTILFKNTKWKVTFNKKSFRTYW